MNLSICSQFWEYSEHFCFFFAPLYWLNQNKVSLPSIFRHDEDMIYPALSCLLQ